MSFKILPSVTELPAKKFAARVKVYDQILEALESKPKGIYPIEVKDRKPSTVYLALSKRTKRNSNIKLHLIAGKVYIDKKT